MPSDTVDPTTLGDESGRVALRRRREARVDHVHEIPFNEEAEVTCPDCGETITVGIHGETERSYDSCWTWDCDAYHKFERDRDAEMPDKTESSGTKQTTLVTDGGHRPPCEAVENMDPTPPDGAFDLERRVCPNCRLYFDVGASASKVFCSDACRRRHERGELIADGGVDQDDGDTYQCGNCGETRWGGSVSWWTDCEQCGASDWKQAVTDGDDLPRTNAGTPLPELRFVDRFGDGDDVFYAVTEENGVRLYRVTGETTIVRGLLAHDAVIHEPAGDGSVTTPSYNAQYGTIDLYHHMGGREASLRADRILDEPVITLAEVDRV